jgi:hypothetical protein
MNKWRDHLYGYTGIALVLSLWSPLVWFVSATRAYYKMETFVISEMDSFVIVVFFLLAAATLLAQGGFILVAHDMARYARKECEERRGRDAEL